MRKIGLSALVWAGLAAVSTTSVGAVAGFFLTFMLVMLVAPIAYVTGVTFQHVAVAMAILYVVSVVVMLAWGALSLRRGQRDLADALWFTSVNLIGFATVMWFCSESLQEQWPG